MDSILSSTWNSICINPQSKYYDEKTKNVVLKLYKRDFEFFNYSQELND